MKKSWGEKQKFTHSYAKRHLHKFVIRTFLFLCIAIVGLFNFFLTNGFAGVGQELRDLNQEIEVVQAINDELTLAVVDAESIARVTDAVKDLKLVEVTAYAYVSIPTGDTTVAKK
jgi:cell division protein FtsL